MNEFNGVMMQCFHWYTDADGTFWEQLKENASSLVKAGITAVWLPPAYKGSAGGYDVGYGVYDLFDLGEFDQKGSVRTKYGTRDEYIKAIKALQKAGIQVYADIAFNNKLGADQIEEFNATPFNPENRNEPIGELQPIKAWTHYTFPGRKGKYSDLQWHWWHFNAINHNLLDENKNAIYLFEGKKFDENVGKEKGNADYLIGCDLDFNNPEVQKELFYWGEWYLKTTGVDGFRFDAVKHVKSSFFLDWMKHLSSHSCRRLFAVGEYWSGASEELNYFLIMTDHTIMLFDVSLHHNFAKASKLENNYNLQTIFENTLVKNHPILAVTIVNNHDTQPLQTLESVVEAWFKPLAYALILLRKDGYPCIFSADYYGAYYKDTGKDGNEHEVWMDKHQWLIDLFLKVRKNNAFGNQYDYFDHPNCVGWSRIGNDENPGGMAVILSNGDDSWKYMETGYPNTPYIDITNHIKDEIITSNDGWGEFRCNTKSVSVWVPK
ncbi:MAG TPA: alpha-amylase [Ignavibacteriales bacterium]|nr:alpha-amylase [Ignavibacteriales bacterium]